MKFRPTVRVRVKVMDAVGSFSPNAPKSAIIGFAKSDDKFSTRNVVPISPLVEGIVYGRFLQYHWEAVIRNQHADQGVVFESYCRYLMTRPAKVFQSRKCCGMSNRHYEKFISVTLGGCTVILQTLNIIGDAKENKPMILFHSTDLHFPLIDFIYKDDDGTFHAFQATTGQTHRFDEAKLKEYRKVLGTAPLVLYYLVPQTRFDKFVTEPVNPKADRYTRILHVSISKPNSE